MIITYSLTSTNISSLAHFSKSLGNNSFLGKMITYTRLTSLNSRLAKYVNYLDLNFQQDP